MRRACLTALLAPSFILISTPALAAIDGRVEGLNLPVFSALAAIKKRNPGSLTQLDAKELADAVMADGTLDPAERDLLEEMTQSQFRNITATPPGEVTPTSPRATTFPTVGNAKKVLQNVLNPVLDLDGAWTRESVGWREIIVEYKKSAEQEVRVVAFVQQKLAGQWVLSNLGNGYKPLRDQIGRLYGYSNSAGADTNTGRTILYRAMDQLDRNAADAVPDFLYNWTRPGGYL